MTRRALMMGLIATFCLGLAGAQAAAPPAGTSNSAANVTPASALTMTFDSLQGARFVTLPVRVEGDASVLSAEQLQQAVAAIDRNLGAALQLKYPNATITTQTDSAAVLVTPVLVAPRALTMFDALVARLEVRLPGDPRTHVIKQSYGLLSLVSAGGNADMVVLNGLTAQLP